MPRTPSFSLRRGGLRTLATVVLAGLMVVATDAHAATIAPRPAVAVDEGAALPTVVVAAESVVIDRSADDFRFSVLLRNPGDRPLSGGALSVTIGREPLGTPVPAEVADEVAASAPADANSPSLSEQASEVEPLELAQQQVPQTAAGAEQIIELIVPREQMPLVLTRTDGVYELQVEFVPNQPLEIEVPEVSSETQDSTAQDSSTQEQTADAREPLPIVSTTLVVWGGFESATTVPLTLVVPLVLPASIEGVPDRDQLSALSPALLQLLSAAEQHNATIAVDPRIVAATRSLGTSAPPEAVELVERLGRTLSSVFMLQFADADPAVQAALGFEELMQPLGFDYLTRLGTFVAPNEQADGSGTEASDDSETSANSTANAGSAANGAHADITNADTTDNDQGTENGDSTNGDERTHNDESSDAETTASDELTDDNGVPTYEQLMSLNTARAGAWPADGQVDSATLVLLAQGGLDSLVLSSTNVSAATGTRVSLGEFTALIADTDLQAASAAALAATTAVERSAGVSNLASLLALAAAEDSPGLVLALDRGAVADAIGEAEISALFAALDTFAWTQVVAERLQPEGTAALRSAAGDESRRELLRSTMRRSDQIDDLAALLEQPEYLTQYQRARLLEAFSTRYANSRTEFDEAHTLTKLRDEELLQGVQPVTTESAQLVGASSRVPITLNNALPFDARVSLHTVPTSAAISLIERDFEAVVPASGNSAVLVPVLSRVSSGESGLLLEVRDTASEQTFATGIQHLTLRTTVETIIMWVLGVAASLLLGFGVWRSIKRRRSVASLSQSE